MFRGCSGNEEEENTRAVSWIGLSMWLRCMTLPSGAGLSGLVAAGITTMRQQQEQWVEFVYKDKCAQDRLASRTIGFSDLVLSTALAIRIIRVD